MNNNKNHQKEHDFSNAELRKMQPKDNANVGIKNGQHLDTHDGGHEKNGRN